MTAIPLRWGGGAVRLVEEITDPLVLRAEWGHAEKDTYTIPFGPWSHKTDADRGPHPSAGPWVYRYGQGSAGTGSKYEALATRVHADVASRLGGPVVVTLLAPWTATYPFAAEGYLDETYVADKLGKGRTIHPDDLTAITELIRILLGRDG